MRKVIAGTFMSIDGVMQAPGGPEEDPTGGFAYGGWSVNYWDDAMMAEIGKSMADPFDLLLGRKTYEIFAAHWPYVEDDNPVAEKFNAITKYVATSSTEPLTWINSVAINGDVAAGIARLKQIDGPNLLIQGSSQLIHTLLAHDLIDEFNLRIFPLVLGSGKRLFGSGAMPAALKLTDTRTSATGVTTNTYHRAGDVKPGSFVLVETTAAELARRERMKREG